MSPSVLAIDPGTDGALVVLDSDSVICEPMPQLADGSVDYAELLRLLNHYAPIVARVVIEKPYLPPGQNVVAQLTHIGRIQGMLMAAYVRYESVRSADWSKEYPHGVELPKKDRRRGKAIKVARREIAARLYPGIDLRRNARAEVPHEGIVDALLLADFTMRQMRGRLL